MKKILCITILLFDIFISFGQEIIVKVGTKTEIILAKELSLKDNRIWGIKQENNEPFSMGMTKVKEILFPVGSPIQIHQISLTIDSIRCSIDSISAKKIRFRELGQNEYKEIKTGHVFGIFYSENPDPNIPVYQQQFLKKFRIYEDKSMKLYKPDDKRVQQMLIPIYTKNDQLFYRSYVKGLYSSLSDSIKNIQKIENFSSPVLLSKKRGKTIISALQGQIEGATIYSITPDTLYLRKDYGGVMHYSRIPKENINGIYFSPYRTTQTLEYSDFGLMLGYCGGLGYRIAKGPEKMSPSQKKYINKLRLGFVADINTTFTIAKNLGIGFKYNFFASSNDGKIGGNFPASYSDKIRIHYFGSGFHYFLPLEKTKGYFFSFWSAGLSYYTQETMFNQSFSTWYETMNIRETYDIEGKTFGIYIDNGFDFEIQKNIFFGFQVGLSHGLIRKIDINEVSLSLDTPESLLRIDLKGGLKFYL
jgi:hypothetical protein